MFGAVTEEAKSHDASLAVAFVPEVQTLEPLAIRDWADRVAQIRPLEVQVYTFDRLPADPELRPVPRPILVSIADYARRRAGVPVDVY